jgi:four helix bundle protein
MRKSKIQIPKPKQIPSFKIQAEPLSEGWHSVRGESGSSAIELNDKPAAEDRPFDLQERTALFGERIVRFAKQISRNPVTDRLISQLVGAGTSVGANFCAASDSMSKKDFRHSAKRCIKEAKETRHFLRMIVAAEPALALEARALYREATELILILGSMCK